MNQTIDLNSIITAALAPIVRDLVQSSLGQLTPRPPTPPRTSRTSRPP